MDTRFFGDFKVVKPNRIGRVWKSDVIMYSRVSIRIRIVMSRHARFSLFLRRVLFIKKKNSQVTGLAILLLDYYSKF